ncbi:MAG TPA: glycosyltransferase [Spirochaetota bacterium]|nr:glycosyltransferase [Spirochaetota bacterium]HQG43090.1 glycosyltransferase [Spirochaetota bacterium]HQK08196.1 glycosyltransferase [Spirochaetota bacterium]HRR60783.1 glycosyltransferase [Spirochaetota bacterium]HRV15190.1 glycosyltransferase [Spirochaetota bacterium]
MPFFSVVIPVYNRAHTITKAVESVLGQSLADYECIVVDDGSTDTTCKELSPYRKKITYIPIPHGGVSTARNAGIAASRGQWIAFLDSDDVWQSKKLEAHFNYIQLHPDMMIHQTDESWIRRGKRVNPMKKHQKKEGYIFNESLHLCLISPSAVVVHRSLFDTVGLFDEKLPVCEDYDLWLRITWHYRAGFIPDKLIVKYGGHADQLSSQYWGMDRFRVYAICKLLACYGSKLQAPQYTMAVEVALSKCRILLHGANKHSNVALAQKVTRVIEWLTADRQSMQAFPDLVEG